MIPVAGLYSPPRSRSTHDRLRFHEPSRCAQGSVLRPIEPGFSVWSGKRSCATRNLRSCAVVRFSSRRAVLSLERCPRMESAPTASPGCAVRCGSTFKWSLDSGAVLHGIPHKSDPTYSRPMTSTRCQVLQERNRVYDGCSTQPVTSEDTSIILTHITGQLKLITSAVSDQLHARPLSPGPCSRWPCHGRPHSRLRCCRQRPGSRGSPWPEANSLPVPTPSEVWLQLRG